MCDTQLLLKRIGPAWVFLAVVLGILLATTLAADAQNFTTLYKFTGADGFFPEAGLVFDSQGNLYGTTLLGGVHSGGTVFKLTPSRTETVLHSFASRGVPSACRNAKGGGLDGATPTRGLVLDSQGNLYGTTERGGTCGFGTVFRVT